LGAKPALFRPDSGCRYIAFNKPYAVLCQFSTPEDSDKTVLSAFGFPKNVYSVGRLDYDSEGLLILTDDARLNTALLDPQFGHARTYLAQVETVPTAEQLTSLASGIELPWGMTRQAAAELLSVDPGLPPRPVPIRERKNIPTAWIKLTVTEGKNRQVRKMTAAAGCPTLRLVRISIGALTLDGLKLAPGEWRDLSHMQLGLLFQKNESNDRG
jgi:23S rRNA pseudouridine2457 synthase